MTDHERSAMKSFLFADLRGYTDFVEAHGDHAAAALLDGYRGLVRAAVAEQQGAEVKTEGDSFYVAFESASAAVRCGLRIVATAATAPQPIAVGVGIHAGETVETTEGYVGSAVNVAARICAQAAAGEVLVSDTVRSLTRTHVDASFVAIGTRALKGVSEPVPLYRVLPPGTATPAATVAAAASLPRARWPFIVGPVAIIGVVLLALLLLAGMLGGGAGAPSPSPAPVATAAPSPTSLPQATSPPFPSAAEADLLARLPASVTGGSDCHRTTPAQQARAATASIRCDLPPGAGADTVWYDRIDPSTDTLQRYLDAIAIHRVDEGHCDTSPKAWQEWQLPGFFSGHLVCYPEVDGSGLTWTYEAQGILARAHRPDTDWAAFYRWWQSVAAFLRH